MLPSATDPSHNPANFWRSWEGVQRIFWMCRMSSKPPSSEPFFSALANTTPQPALSGRPRDEGGKKRDAPSASRRHSLPRHVWGLLKETFAGFFEDEALTRGAA